MGVLLKMENIIRDFSGVRAVDNVTFNILEGEVHALVGENGAGKSTLMKILSGAYRANSGNILLREELIEGITPHKMIDLGISVIYQEFMLAPHLSIMENIFLGRFPRINGLINYKKMAADTKKIFSRLNMPLKPSTLVCDLSVAKQQMVEIARAMSTSARIIVLDEPSAALGESELEGLFKIIRNLKLEGISFIYISHRLKEVFQIADRITVLKDGKHVITDRIEAFDTERIIKSMVGRDLKNIYPERRNKCGKTILEVLDVNRKSILNNVEFRLKKGEILGIAGLAGAGRTEILRAILGADKIDSGEIKINGSKVSIKSPKDAIKLGIGILSEDRKEQGLFLQQSTKYNSSISSLNKISKWNIIDSGTEKRNAQSSVDSIRIKPPQINFMVKNMSGGNQQKVIFARWLNSDCRILLVDEPTRGVDVGAKQEIYHILNSLTKTGVSIIMVSSELPELLGMSDRILVMCDGRIKTVLNRGEATEDTIMKYATDHEHNILEPAI